MKITQTQYTKIQTNITRVFFFVLICAFAIVPHFVQAVSYEFTPTSGALIRGDETAVTSATAAAAADGTNVGSWKATLADDGFHWKALGTTTAPTGIEMHLIVGDVALNGANTMMIQTEMDNSASTPQNVLVQVCDWVNPDSVNNSADSRCTGGGWRTLNNRQVALTTGTATQYHWQIYNGYWQGNDTDTPANTPLTNFLGAQNQVLIRYYSTTNSVDSVAIDFLRILPVINPVYTASGISIISSDAVITGVATSTMMYGIAKDSTYMYAVGYDDNSNWRIEKRLLSSGLPDTSFGNTGAISSDTQSNTARAIAIDSTYMYVVGVDDSTNWRIEKRLLSTGALDSGFGTAGVVTGVSATNVAYGIAVDSTYMYVVGDDSNGHWRIEKRLLSTGALETATFGSSSGIVTGAASSAIPYGIKIDSTYMYIVGDDTNTNFRIEKRLLTTGATDNTFGTNGVITGAGGSRIAYGIAIDSTYMYVVGYDSTPDFRIEKRLLSTGAVDNGFGTSGVITGATASQAAYSVDIDSTYMYVVGYDSSGNFRIEKRTLSTGAVDNGFGSSGIVSGATASEQANAITIDSTYMYVVGYDSSNNSRIEKHLLSTGASPTGFGNASAGNYTYTTVVTQGASDDNRMEVGGTTTNTADFYYSFKNVETYPSINTVLVRVEASCSAATADLSYKYALRNFNTNQWEDISNPVDCSVADSTYVFAKSGISNISNYVSGGEIRLRVYGSSASATTIRTDQIYIQLGTTAQNPANSEVSFGSATGGRIQENPSSPGADQITTQAIDSSYLYLAGYDTYGGDTEWRLEKRDITTGELVSAFGTGGIITEDPSTGADQISAIAINASYIFIAGFDSATTNNEWRIEKRDITTGALVTAFDTDGIITNNTSANQDRIYSIALDASYVYIVGEDRTLSTSNAQIRIEKRDITTGALVTAFDTDGILTINPTVTNDIPYKILVDGSYIYLTASTAVGTGWYLAKLDITTGASTYAVSEDVGSSSAEEPFTMAIDANYIYLGGYDNVPGNNEWRIEKRNIGNGSLETATFGSATGIVTTNPSTGVDQIKDIEVDANYIYASGADSNTGRWRIEKRDISTGNLVTNFSNTGIVISEDAGDDRILSASINANYIFASGYGTGPGNNQWMTEKRDISTGLLVSAFNPTTATSTASLDYTGGTESAWLLQTEDESNNRGLGTQYGYYAFDTDGDAVQEEAAAANIDIAVTPPQNAQITSILSASRINGGAGGTAQLGIKDYSGINQATGGWLAINTTSTVNETYMDNITSAASALVVNGGAAGLWTNPGAFINTNTGEMNVRLRTQSDGATTNDSTYAWDFAMVSLQYINAPTTPTVMFQFTPTNGELVTGTASSTTSMQAAAVADGTNLGSWKATLADDGYHWTVLGTTTAPYGVEMQLTVGNVSLNGANTMFIQTEMDNSVPSAQNVLVQICDWVNPDAVNNLADSRCTGGGWRTLNSTSTPLYTGTATQYSWQIYNGYWQGSSSNNPSSANTPLSNFLGAQNQVLIRYYSTTNSTASVAVDFLRIFPVINPIYTASGQTVLTTSKGILTDSSSSNSVSDVAIDSIYMYVAGSDDSFRWRIEKRRLSDGTLDTSFGSNGVVTEDTLNQTPVSVAIDSTYMYVVGNVNWDDWRIEKRRLSDGTLDTSFGSNGVVTGDVSSNTLLSIAIDSTYMYLVGGSDTGDWRIEKRRLSDGSFDTGFGTSGVVAGDASSDRAVDIAIDSTYMYVAGLDSTSHWRIEKRRLSDGSFDTGFGTSGVVAGDASSYHLNGMKIDSTYMYVVGDSRSDSKWRIEKRRLSDGTLDTSFGSNGIVNGFTSNYGAVDIAVDSTYMYVDGIDSTPDWHIEKRRLSDGSLDTSFGSSGAVTGDASSDTISSITIDSTYMYVVGKDITPDGRIEKRKLSDGNPSGTDGFGLTTGSYTYTTTVSQGASDDTRFEVAGTATSAADFYFSFKNVETYSSMNAITVRVESSCSAATAGLSYKFALQNYTTGEWNDASNSIDCNATDATFLFAKTGISNITDYVQGGEIRLRMYGSSASATTLRVDQIYIQLGTVATDSSNYEVSFGSNTAGRLTENPSSPSADQITAQAIDASYLYLGGYDTVGSLNEWRIEKRDITTGALISAFGTGGIIQEHISALSDQVTSIAVNATSIFVAGYDGSNGGQWRLEKRDITTGALDTSFNSTGVVTRDFSASFLDKIYSIAIDASYIYVVGDDRSTSNTNSQWHIEKWDITTGALVTAFDTDGIVTSNPSSTVDTPYSIKVDSNYIYIGGSSVTTNMVWYMEKRDKTTGALVAAFNSGGSITENIASSAAEEIFSLAIDGNYVYLAGYDGAQGTTNYQWRIEKRNITTGALETTTFGSATGIIQSNPGTSGDAIKDIEIDGSYIYAVGYQHPTSGNMRIEKRDIGTGALVTAFNGTGVVSTDDGTDDRFNIASINGSYIFASGYGTGPTNAQWIVEKRDITTGLPVATFNAPNSATSTANMDYTSNESLWTLLTEDESTNRGTGSQYSYYPFDTDADVNVEEAAAANIDFAVTAPTNAQVTGILSSGRMSSGGDVVQLGLRDYSGANNATGGWVTANNVTSVGGGLLYADNISSTGSFLSGANGGPVGQQTNPYSFINTNTGKMNLRLRTSTDGATTNNSVHYWDYAMVSLQWVATSTSARTYDQSGYRFFNASTTGMLDIPMANANTQSTVDANANLRLRMLVHVDNQKVQTGEEQFKLQIGALNGSCSVTSYTDVTALTPIAFKYLGVENASDISATTTDPTHTAHTNVTQTSAWSNNVPIRYMTLSGQDMLFDYSLYNYGAANATYCFRMVKSDGTHLYSYSQYPMLEYIIPATYSSGGGGSYWSVEAGSGGGVLIIGGGYSGGGGGSDGGGGGGQTTGGGQSSGGGGGVSP